MKKNKLTLIERRDVAKLTLPTGLKGWTGILKGTHKKETYDNFNIPTLESELPEYFKTHPIKGKYFSLEGINPRVTKHFKNQLEQNLKVKKNIVTATQPIKITTYCGDNIHKVAEKAKETVLYRNKVLHIDNTIAVFDFNDIKCVVDKDTNLDWLIRDYMNAHIMKWKQVGPLCLEAYEPEVQAELEKREKANEKKQEIELAAYRAKENRERKLFEEKIKGIEMEFSDKKGWDDWKANQKDNSGYGLAIFQYAEFWAKRMQKEFADRNIENPDVACMVAHADYCANELNFLGITGFMYGAAVATLAKCWKHGEALRKWHNKEWGAENSEGVVNPAMLTIKTDED
jgi:hypothetical protein